MLGFLQALSELGIRSPPGPTTGHSDTEKVCSPSLSLGMAMWRYLTLFFFFLPSFVHETNRNSKFPASFYL